MRPVTLRAAAAVMLVPSFCFGASLRGGPPDHGGHSTVVDAVKPATQSGGFDLTNLDTTVKPCDDFYQFACGGWIKRTPIPPDRSAWGRSFYVIHDQNEDRLRQILEGDAAGKPGPDDPYAQKLGDFYATCMDEPSAETASLATLRESLRRIDSLKDQKALATEVAALHQRGASVFFSFGSQQDFKDATQVIGVVDQDGLGLPDRDYYLKDDPKSQDIRKKYQEHISRMLGLAGDAKSEAAAAKVLAIETALAKVALDRTERRDPHKIYHRLERKGLASTAPRFPWDVYFAASGAPEVQAINVTVPAFFTGLSELLQKTPIAELKPYLRWHAVHHAAGALGKAFVDEDFRFRSSAFTGEKQILPRWKRCVEATDGAMGEALARPFVRLTFGEEGKQLSQEMIRGIEAAFERDLATLSWMDDATRTAARDKMRRIVNKIGYPDRWRNYDGLAVSRKSYLENRDRAAAFERARDLAKIGKPVDATEWLMSPPQVNAYYEPSRNEIVFPAGILQAPFFNKDAPLAQNYGAIGMVMGHELTHGFDDEGRQFDGAGNLRDWWSKDVGQAFNDRAACVAKQYDGYTILDKQKVNGKLTLGENIADIGGLKLALMAFRAARAGKVGPKIGGFSEEQQFFLAFAQGWCSNRREELARVRLVVDPHSPPEYRVNGPLSASPEFQAAFNCPAGSPMAPQDRCSVW